jgi:hypothetical protein
MDKVKLERILLEIQKVEIPEDVYDYEKGLSKIQITKLTKEYGNVRDYLSIMYYLRFVRKMENREIAEILGLKVVVIHIAFYNFLWGDSKVWCEASNYRKNKIEEAGELREKGKKINVENYPELVVIINNANKYKNKMNFKGFGSSDEFLKVMAYYIYIEKLSTRDLIAISMCTHGTLNYKLNIFGISLSHDEGISEKKRRGSQDYVKSISKGKRTTLKSQAENASVGTKNENYARNYFSYHYPEFFDTDIFEVVIGCNNTGILGSKEIDIPIFVLNKQSEKLYKIAVEYNGYFHTLDDRDKEKILIAEEKGWGYLKIDDDPIYSNDKSRFETVLRSVLLEIRSRCESN